MTRAQFRPTSSPTQFTCRERSKNQKTPKNPKENPRDTTAKVAPMDYCRAIRAGGDRLQQTAIRMMDKWHPTTRPQDGREHQGRPSGCDWRARAAGPAHPACRRRRLQRRSRNNSSRRKNRTSRPDDQCEFSAALSACPLP